MKAKQLAQVIKKIVREEVQKEVRSVLKEHLSKSKPVNSNNNKKSLTLTEALQETAQEDYPTMQTFTSADARAGFSALQQGTYNTNNNVTAFQGHNGRVIPADKVDPTVSKALTRDYTELVKRFKK